MREKGQSSLLDLDELGIVKGDDGSFKVRSKTLKASDIGPIGTVVQGKILDKEWMDFRGAKKLGLLMDMDMGEKESERLRKLALNKTNTVTLLGGFGENFGNWQNKIIEIVIESVEYNDEETSGMRVRIPPEATTQAKIE